MDQDTAYENWINGNCKDVVEAIIASGKMSKAVEFALRIQHFQGCEDSMKFVRMLENRDK